MDAGAKDIVVGVGGSASTDGGLGALRALYPLHRLRGVTIEVAFDVRLRFLDCARVFGPQKGATPAEVELLTRRLERLAEMYRDEYGVEVADLEGSGAAGGLAGGLACVGAELVPGFDLVAERVGLDEAVEGADVVVTGEGFLDEESFDGKVVGGVSALAGQLGVPVVAIVGECFDGAEERIATVSLVARFGRDRAMADAAACLGEAVPDALGHAR
jgi:glycerate kinase